MNLSIQLQALTPEIFARLPTHESKRAVLVAALRETPDVQAVAEKTGANVVALWRLARKENINLSLQPLTEPAKLARAPVTKKSAHSSFISHAIHSAIIADLEENPDAAAITDKYKGEVSYRTILKIAAENKIPLKRGAKKKLTDAKILEIYNECKDVDATAKAGRICKVTVVRALKRLDQWMFKAAKTERLERRLAKFKAVKAAGGTVTGALTRLDEGDTQKTKPKDAERLKRMWAKFNALTKT